MLMGPTFVISFTYCFYCSFRLGNRSTPYGRSLFAVGGNSDARRVGMKIKGLEFQHLQ